MDISVRSFIATGEKWICCDGWFSLVLLINQLELFSCRYLQSPLYESASWAVQVQGLLVNWCDLKRPKRGIKPGRAFAISGSSFLAFSFHNCLNAP